MKNKHEMTQYFFRILALLVILVVLTALTETAKQEQNISTTSKETSEPKIPDQDDSINIKRRNIVSQPLTWKIYDNNFYGFSFKYPDILGDVVELNASIYHVNSYKFSDEELSHMTSISIFTDESVSDWDEKVKKIRAENDSLPEMNALGYSTSIKEILITDNDLSDCSAVIKYGDVCKVVEVNGRKAFRVVKSDTFHSYSTRLEYIFM